jgi:hypothetical protein
MVTLPTVPGSVIIDKLNASILKPKQPDAQQIVDRFNGKAPAAPAAGQTVPPGVLPSSVRMRVLNGSGVAGQATKVAGELGPSGLGFSVAGTGDADSFRYNQSVISYGPGQLPKAQLLQAALVTPAQLKQDNSLKGVDVVLVAGTDFSGVRPLPDSAGATATTTTPTTAPPADGNATGKSPADSC